MIFSSQQVLKTIPELVIQPCNAEHHFSKISSAEDFDKNSLIFVSNQSQQANLDKAKPAVIITNKEIAANLSESDISKDVCVIAVKDVRLAQSIVKSSFADYDPLDSEWPDIHHSAVIHPTAKIGNGVRIGPNSVIGKGVQIGDQSIIRANCVIGHDVVIGRHCKIHNLVNINYQCTLGNRVVIQTGAVIGGEGFGFAQDNNRRYHHIPHSGIVEIHDDVQVGVNSNIDRATYGKTIIGRGVKLDALCHVAHNVVIGEDALFVAQSGVAGSTKVGKRVIASGQTGVLDHRTIADDAILVHRCGVTEDITSSGMWAGTPPRPFKEYVQNLNMYKKMKKLETRLNSKLQSIEDKLTELDSKS